MEIFNFKRILKTKNNNSMYTILYIFSTHENDNYETSIEFCKSWDNQLNNFCT